MKKIKTYPTTFAPISEGELRSKDSIEHQPSVGVRKLTENRQKFLEKIALESKVDSKSRVPSFGKTGRGFAKQTLTDGQGFAKQTPTDGQGFKEI